MKGLVYLATPYSHKDPAVQERRFRVVNAVAAALMREGFPVFSPISHTHPIAQAGDLPGDWDYWEEYDRVVLSACSMMIVVAQPGWIESKGVTAEMDIAREMGIPIEFASPESYGIDLYAGQV